jgi:hypothetical protein
LRSLANDCGFTVGAVYDRPQSAIRPSWAVIDVIDRPYRGEYA